MNDILDILHKHLITFLTSSALLWMACNAFFGTMPAQLPGWRECPQWLWSWFAAAARTFCSLHGGRVTEKTEPIETK